MSAKLLTDLDIRSELLFGRIPRMSLCGSCWGFITAWTVAPDDESHSEIRQAPWPEREGGCVSTEVVKISTVYVIAGEGNIQMDIETHAGGSSVLTSLRTRTTELRNLAIQLPPCQSRRWPLQRYGQVFQMW